MNSPLVKYIFCKIRSAIAVGSVVFSFFLISFTANFALRYLTGFTVGIVNFIMQATAYNIMLSSGYKHSGLIQVLLFILRYSIIVLAAVRSVGHNAANILAFGAGLLTINFLVIVSSYSRHLPAEKEG